MTDREAHARDVRRSLTDIVRVCSALGIERSKTERGKYVCPRHGGGSLSVTLGQDRTIRVRCFGCDLAGDVYTLIAEARGLDVRRDFPAVLLEAAEMAGEWGIVDALKSGGTTRANPTRKPIPVLVEDERTYPPDAAALWAQCGYTADDTDACAYLEGRGLDAELVDDGGLARVIPKDATLPAWARYGAQSWTETGHRLVLPVYDAKGMMRSVRAMRIVDGDTPKRLPPKGHKAGGLVLGDTFAVGLLRLGRWVEGMATPLRIIIAEGEPDFLTWATRFSDADADAPIVLGVVSGAWTNEVAARIPDGTEVAVRTHHDDAGEKYAAQIIETLGNRCTVRRRAKEKTT